MFINERTLPLICLLVLVALGCSSEEEQRQKRGEEQEDSSETRTVQKGGATEMDEKWIYHKLAACRVITTSTGQVGQLPSLYGPLLHRVEDDTVVLYTKAYGAIQERDASQISVDLMEVLDQISTVAVDGEDIESGFDTDTDSFIGLVRKDNRNTIMFEFPRDVLSSRSCIEDESRTLDQSLIDSLVLLDDAVPY